MSDTSLPPPPPLPVPKLTQLDSGLVLLEPLSKRGYGPGLVVITPETDESVNKTEIKNGVPAALLKWAEEGYTVVEISKAALGKGTQILSLAADALSKSEKCQPKGPFGLIAYDPDLWNQVVPTIGSRWSDIAGVIVYGDTSNANAIAPAAVPSVHHLAGKADHRLERSSSFTAYDYPSEKTFLFATPHQPQFHYSSESVSHTRNLTFLKRLMNGPYFDLEALWDEHTYYEFGARSVEHTMSTMVQEPYVNHIPTMTGGIGREKLSSFYAHHFVFNNPEDSELELISRTVGIDRVIDEFIFKLTHNKVVDWLLPGVPPTNKRLEIPFTAVVNIRGDRLYHEHIAWDQGSALAQCGLLPEYLPYPHPLPDGRTAGHGKRFEYRVPVAGIEAAEKMRDKNAVESNKMFEYGIREVDA